MAKDFKPVVVTANDLIEGDSVFLGACGWVRDIRMARVALSGDEAGVLETAGFEGEAGNVVVGPYLIEVSLATGVPVPVLRREQIRASGVPTIPFGLDAPAERRAA
jgi:sulfite reductase (NADPH) hemoprotein beta-component